MSEHRKIGHPRFSNQLAYYFVAAILPMGASVVGMAWALRLVSPSDFGLFNLASATASIAATGAFHWLCQWILRYGPQFVAPDARVAHWAVLWRGTAMAGGLLVAVALLVLALRWNLSSLVGATFLLCATLATQNILVTVLQGTGRAQHYTQVLAVSAMVRWICSIACCYLWNGAVPLWWALVCGQLIGQIVATVLGLIALRATVSFPSFGQSESGLQRQALSYGAPFLLWAVSTQLLNVGDRFVVQGFRGPHEVGMYSAVYNLANAAVMVLTNPILLALTPQIFSRAGIRPAALGANEDVRKLAERGLQFLLMLGIPLLLFSLLLRRELVALVLGEAYRSASSVFPAVVCGTLIWQVAQIYQKGFETAAQTRAIGTSILYAVVVNVIANLLLVPRLGIDGAAVATILGYLCYFAIVAVRVGSFGRPSVQQRTAFSIAMAAAVAFLVFRIGAELIVASWLRLSWGAACAILYLAVLLLRSEPLLVSQVRRIQVAMNLQ